MIIKSDPLQSRELQFADVVYPYLKKSVPKSVHIYEDHGQDRSVMYIYAYESKERNSAKKRIHAVGCCTGTSTLIFGKILMRHEARHLNGNIVNRQNFSLIVMYDKLASYS